MSGAHLRALGDELRRVHDRLREQLVVLREGAGPSQRFAGRTLGADCLAFCSAVTRHHTAEDRTAFPLLATRHPELQPVLEGLAQDHEMIATILTGIESVARAIHEEPSPARVRSLSAELDGLAAIVESHFSWEERRILDALDEIDGLTPEELLGADRLAPDTPGGPGR